MLKPVSDDDELKVLKDNNLEVIHSNPEFQTNKQPERPTNRICTSLLSRERLAFILRYALAYVSESDGLQKHIMRYPQLFATKAIERKLSDGVKKGIIWHTQGSGKTALTFYNVRFLTDYFQKQQVIPKFYFIVDRLDLLQQAQREFTARALTVHTINSRDAFTRDIKATQVIHNHSGKPEITVVNIQKFKDDRGILIGSSAVSLHVPVDLMFTCDVLLNTPGIVGSADNDINSVRNLGVFPSGYFTNRRFTDTNGYFIKTDVPNGSKMFNRTPLQTKMEPDFDTGNLRFKARERYSFGVSDWRGWFGNQGA